MIRDAHPPLWQVLQNPGLADVTIGRLLEEAVHLRRSGAGRAGGARSETGALPFQRFLTDREGQVAALVAQGASNREIGDQLELSAKTVKNHVSNILRKLALQRRTQIAIMALRRDRMRA